MERKQMPRASTKVYSGTIKKFFCALAASTIMSLPSFSQDYSSLANKLVAGENVSLRVKAQKVQDNVYSQLQKLQRAVDAQESGTIVVVKNLRNVDGELSYTFSIIRKKEIPEVQIKNSQEKAVKRVLASPDNSAKNEKNSSLNENVLQKREQKNENINQVLPQEGEKIRKRVLPKEEEGPVKGPSWQKWDVDTTEALKGLPLEEKKDGMPKEIITEEKPLIEKDSSFVVEQALDSAKIDTNIVEKKNGIRKNGKMDLLAYADKLSDDGKFDEALGIYEGRIGNARYTTEVQLKIARNLMLSARQVVGNNLFDKYEDEKNANLKAYVYYDDAIRILKTLEARDDITKKERDEIHTMLSCAYRGRGVCGSYYGARNYEDRNKDIDSSQALEPNKWMPKSKY